MYHEGHEQIPSLMMSKTSAVHNERNPADVRPMEISQEWTVHMMLLHLPWCDSWAVDLVVTAACFTCRSCLFPDLILLTGSQKLAHMFMSGRYQHWRVNIYFSYALLAARWVANNRRQPKAMAHNLPAACLGRLVVPPLPAPIQTTQTAGGSPASILMLRPCTTPSSADCLWLPSSFCAPQSL